MSIPAQEMEKVHERLAALLAEGDRQALLHALEELHPSDIADLVEALEDDHRIHVLSVLPADVASETLAEMEEGEDRADLLAALHPARSAELLQEMADDDAADLLGELEPHERHRIFEQLSEEDAGDIRGLLLYGEETAGGLMTTELVSVAATLTAAEALVEVRRQGREVERFYTVFVVDRRRRLLGTVGLDALVTAEPEERVEALVEPPAASVLPDTDQEEVSRLIARYNLASIPVVDEFGVLLGRITFDDVLDVLEEEQTEDILRLAGAGSDDDALRYTWREAVRARLPWLFVNLVTASMASSVVYFFSETIESVVILAAIMPIVAGMGGNAGTQALAVTVRGIALEGSSARRRGPVVGREMLIGLVNGLVIGAVVSGLSMALGGSAMLGVVVLLAMWGNLIVAGFLGSFVPTVMARLGVDPAVASSMFVTPFTDLCGFFLLLSLASAMLL
jgi:magnesium transporter